MLIQAEIFAFWPYKKVADRYQTRPDQRVSVALPEIQQTPARLGVI